MRETAKNRDTDIDFVRCMAILAVIAIHVNALITKNFSEKSLSFMVGYIQLTNFAVPCFFIISGYLLSMRLRNTESHYWFAYTCKKAWRTYKVYWIWVLVYLFFQSTLNPQLIYWSVIKITWSRWIFGPGTNAHLWFLPVLSVAYFAVYMSHRYLRVQPLMACVVIGYFSVLGLGYYKDILPWQIGSYNNNYIAGVTFCLLGAAFERKNLRIQERATFIFFAVCICVGLMLTFFEAIHFYATKNLLRSDFLLGTIFYSSGVFWLPRVCNPSRKLRFPCFQKVSRLSLGIYVIHPLIIRYFYPHFQMNWSAFSPWITFHLLIIFTFFISILAVIGLLNSKCAWMVS